MKFTAFPFQRVQKQQKMHFSGFPTQKGSNLTLPKKFQNFFRYFRDIEGQNSLKFCPSISLKYLKKILKRHIGSQRLGTRSSLGIKLQARVVTFVIREYQVMHIKFQGNPPISSRKKDFLMLLAYMAFSVISVM